MAVLSVTQDQKQDEAGNTTDVLDLTFTVDDSAQPYTLQVPMVGDYVQAAHDAISAFSANIRAIRAL